MSSILVVGSGRMGRDLGLWLLRLGHRVRWISREPRRLAALQAYVDRALRRWQREGSAADSATRVAYGAPADLPALAPPDILLEAVEEEANAKREVLARAAVWGPRQPLLLSTTSSFHPSQLHPRCLVTHFFFPVEVTGLVEVVGLGAAPEDDRERLHKLLYSSALYVIQQSDRQAFAVNRLLLPTHAECVRLVRLGLAPALADQAAASGILGVAPLALAERVGHVTLRTALANYAAVASAPSDYRELVESLAVDRVETPPDRVAAVAPSLAEASALQQAVQLNACLQCVRDGLASERDLDWLLPSFYGRSCTLAGYLAGQDQKAIATRLRALHAQTGRQYFQPAACLASP